EALDARVLVDEQAQRAALAQGAQHGAGGTGIPAPDGLQPALFAEAPQQRGHAGITRLPGDGGAGETIRGDAPREQLPASEVAGHEDHAPAPLPGAGEAGAIGLGPLHVVGELGVELADTGELEGHPPQVTEALAREFLPRLLTLFGKGAGQSFQRAGALAGRHAEGEAPEPCAEPLSHGQGQEPEGRQRGADQVVAQPTFEALERRRPSGLCGRRALLGSLGLHLESGYARDMSAREYNFDGLVGPTHNYAGLSPGNVASLTHGGQESHPRAAALQGLGKMRFVAGLGVGQAVLPPQPRPSLRTLRELGFSGTDEAILTATGKDGGHLLRVCSSASSMWTANAATVAPSTDTADGTVHLTPANLQQMFHRA